jgi:hypothetical protein
VLVTRHGHGRDGRQSGRWHARTRRQYALVG